VIPGAIEALLSLAEAAIRQGKPAEGKRALRAAQAILSSCGAPGDIRMAGVRAPLLRARVDLLKGLGRRELGEVARSVRDLLAQVEGEPVLRELADQKLIAACVRYAIARLAGGPGEVEESRSGIEEARGRIAGKLLPGDRKSFLGRDPLERFGLEAIGLPGKAGGDHRLREIQVRVLEDLLGDSALAPPQPASPQGRSGGVSGGKGGVSSLFYQVQREVAARAILEGLRAAEWKLRPAAHLLGISPMKLRSDLREFLLEAIRRRGGDLAQAAAELEIPLEVLEKKAAHFGLEGIAP
jgi:hypothetical protein